MTHDLERARTGLLTELKRVLPSSRTDQTWSSTRDEEEDDSPRALEGRGHEAGVGRGCGRYWQLADQAASADRTADWASVGSRWLPVTARNEGRFRRRDGPR